MRNLKVGSWYVVTWTDAYSSYDSDWSEVEEFELKPLLIISAGQIVKKSESYITLAQTVDTASGRVSSLMSIPLGMIAKVQRVIP